MTVEDVSAKALADIEHAHLSTDLVRFLKPAVKTRRIAALTASHEAALRRVGHGLILGPWSNVLIYGPRYWPKREHRALVALVAARLLHVYRVSGADVEHARLTTPTDRLYDWYYEVSPPREARDRRRSRTRRRRRR